VDARGSDPVRRRLDVPIGSIVGALINFVAVAASSTSCSCCR
jgi:hypothetical protein